MGFKSELGSGEGGVRSQDQLKGLGKNELQPGQGAGGEWARSRGVKARLGGAEGVGTRLR